ncbi:MAG: histidine triad nucleotide-binding protein [Firmicutes bacterium]|nr:histidine triad nucleotide-binding protein [Bacillota bacterium]
MSDCLFCRIVNKEIPGQVVFEDDQVLGFKDISPMAPVHVLLVPKRHISTLNDTTEADIPLLGHINRTAAKLAEQLGIAESGYRLVLNCGADGGQTVFHLHAHLLGGRDLHWPPG